MATSPDTQDEFAPILPGPGASDYERYLRTDELLSLQKTEDERAHHDELLFQTVHQSSELWLKLAWTEVELAAQHLRAGELAPAIRLLRRSLGCLKRVHDALDMLEHLSPWEYTRERAAGARPRQRLRLARLPQHPARVARARRGVPRAASRGGSERRRAAPARPRARGSLQLAELLIEWDERITHVARPPPQGGRRIIGEGQIGTQGTPVELLAQLIHQKLYPELWDVRNELTTIANGEIAEAGSSPMPGHGA